jgi:hypothetical protein
VSFGAPLHACADLERDIPVSAGERQDRIGAALATLSDEQRRLERLGLEWPLARCRQQLRYWQFLDALFTLESGNGR